MDYLEFARASGADGVFRGFREGHTFSDRRPRVVVGWDGALSTLAGRCGAVSG